MLTKKRQQYFFLLTNNLVNNHKLYCEQKVIGKKKNMDLLLYFKHQLFTHAVAKLKRAI